MLTPILPIVLPAPRPASSHILNQSLPPRDLPAGDSGTADLGFVGTAAQIEHPSTSLDAGSEVWMRARLTEAVEHGEVVKLTGARSISTPGSAA